MKSSVNVQGTCVRVIRKGEAYRKLIWGILAYGGALLVMLLTMTLFIIGLGYNPLVAYQAALKDSLFSIGGIAQTLNRMTPLLLASLAFTIGMRGGVFNIGIDGQIYLGAILAGWVGIFLVGGVNIPWLQVPIVLIAGLVGGALYILVAAILRMVWGVNEIFTTVMLNFVALLLVEFLTTGPWNDPLTGEAVSVPITPGAVLPKLLPRGGAHVGVIIAILTAILIWWLLYRTVLGYEIRAVGSNWRASLFGGIAVRRVQFLALALSGALGGLAGAIEVAGVHERVLLGLTPNYGVMAILIAVLARGQPLALIPVSFIFGVLVAGADSLQRSIGLPAGAVFMVQGVAVLIVLLMEAVSLRHERLTI
ncbi:simple sugar transport system permease protein [Thermanaeromonas toyohensis ToBE]|uniref:Simple sugar transport system permease protein n=1 Tax=Thermanaeromonas toyohensis ToBE TaxID=698762 RepID=A0A1W1W2A8_9FIRM|nr:ABC transporter permease [Thermanaeromonas toyohensis]SMB99759.1 simple sugar transport system permease protein [Thermanaeromonas toyohensis ToBE]